MAGDNTSEYKVRLTTEGDTSGAEKVKAAVEDAGGAAKKAGAETEGAGSDGLAGLAGAGQEKLAGLIGKFAGVAGAALSAGKVLHEALSAYSESEEASLKLSNALDQTGQAAAGAQEQIEALAHSEQILTNVSDETWTEAAAKLVEFGQRVDEIPPRSRSSRDSPGGWAATCRRRRNFSPARWRATRARSRSSACISTRARRRRSVWLRSRRSRRPDRA